MMELWVRLGPFVTPGGARYHGGGRISLISLLSNMSWIGLSREKFRDICGNCRLLDERDVQPTQWFQVSDLRVFRLP